MFYYPLLPPLRDDPPEDLILPPPLEGDILGEEDLLGALFIEGLLDGELLLELNPGLLLGVDLEGLILLGEVLLGVLLL